MPIDAGAAADQVQIIFPPHVGSTFALLGITTAVLIVIAIVDLLMIIAANEKKGRR